MAKYEFSDSGNTCVVTKRVWWAPWRKVQATLTRDHGGPPPNWRYPDREYVSFLQDKMVQTAWRNEVSPRWFPVKTPRLPEARLLIGKTTL